METVMTRIMEIEKQSALDIERAEDACRKHIEVHRRALEEEKERAQNLIITKENTRLAEALRSLNERTEKASLAEGKNYENLFQDPATITAIKEKIVDILLAE
jgi:hypothetical protein